MTKLLTEIMKDGKLGNWGWEVKRVEIPSFQKSKFQGGSTILTCGSDFPFNPVGRSKFLQFRLF